jgi:DNA polymerase III subunit gamma/tau
MREQHLALYRKYRPNIFSDVVGQEQLVTLLTSTIKQKKIAHAYLFSGGRGTGKTTVARIFARDIGCNPEDIIEIDAASNRGIDEIRELREAVRTAPFSSPYKVYIVDEAHMLTKEAANALLKTLEEPPRHVIFILATTDPEKLPTTIVSRCQKIAFKQPDIKTLADRLVHVAKEEGYTLNNESAELLARHSKGSYRDGLGILEQILATESKNIKYEKVVEILGTPEKEALVELLEMVCTKNQKEITTRVNNLSGKSNTAIRSYDEFIEIIRQALLIRIGEGKEKSELSRIATMYPHTIGSKMILSLLEKRHLLEVSDAHAWTAFTAIMLLQAEN